MADRFRSMAFSIDTDRLSLRLRTKDDAECNLELLRDHEGGTTLSVGEVRRGVGSTPCRRRISHSLEGARRTPIVASSPWILR
jgi:hypothetical protein